MNFKKILMAIMAGLMLTACGTATSEGEPEATPITVKPAGDAEEEVPEFNIKNPWKGIAFEDIKETVGFELPVGETITFGGKEYKASACSYAEGEIVEVIYEDGAGNLLTFRETYAPTDKDISGVYDEFTINDVMSVGKKTLLRFKGTDNGITVATWYDDAHAYSLSSTQPQTAATYHEYMDEFVARTYASEDEAADAVGEIIDNAAGVYDEHSEEIQEALGGNVERVSDTVENQEPQTN